MRMYIYALRMIELQRQTAVLQLLAAVCSGYTGSDYCCMLLLLLYDRLCKYLQTITYVLLYEYIVVFSLNEGNKCVLLYLCTYAYACVRTRWCCCCVMYDVYSSAVVCCCCWT